MIPDEFIDKALFIVSHIRNEYQQDVIGFLRHPNEDIIGIAFDETIGMTIRPMINFVTRTSNIEIQNTMFGDRLVWRNTTSYDVIAVDESVSSAEVAYVIPIAHPIIKKALLAIDMRQL